MRDNPARHCFCDAACTSSRPTRCRNRQTAVHALSRQRRSSSATPRHPPSGSRHFAYQTTTQEHSTPKTSPRNQLGSPPPPPPWHQPRAHPGRKPGTYSPEPSRPATTNPLLCRAFAKPAVGLEPTTTSLQVPPFALQLQIFTAGSFKFCAVLSRQNCRVRDIFRDMPSPRPLDPSVTTLTRTLIPTNAACVCPTKARCEPHGRSRPANQSHTTRRFSAG